MLEFEGHPIQVAVRLSPNSSDQHKRDTNPIVNIEDSTTVSIRHPEVSSEIRVFGFSHCYWSYDGFAELQDGHLLPDLKHPNGSKYCDQKKIFDNFGKEMVQNAWLGYNSALLSIGDSGSGKSFTLFGNGFNKGFMQQFGTELFKSLKDKEKSAGTSPVANPMIEVKMTMMEIYESKVRDLLAGNTTKYKNNTVKVREHPKRGFYVEGLRSVIVTSGEDIQQRMDEGHTSRATNSTFFNLTSHRSKATIVVGFSLVQKYRNAKGDEVTMSSLVDFFDLPVSGNSEGFPVNTQNQSSKHQNPSHAMTHKGKLMWSTNTSEITSKREATKQTLDHHLTTLVSALGSNSTVSYANSTVTKLLERTLSGNCKTYVMAHCNPTATETSYDTCLATLSFADKLQRLRTHPNVNEEMTSKVTRELKLENDNLRKMLANGDYDKNECFAWTDKLELLSANEKNEEFRKCMIEDIKSQVKDNEREIKILNQSQEDKIKLAKLDKPHDHSQSAKKLETDKKHKPFILNLNPDSQLVGRLVHFISPGQTDFGSGKGPQQQGKDGTSFISLIGAGIHELHGTFSNSGNKENKTTIKSNGMDCWIKINGQSVLYESPLFHNERLIVGGSQIWLFQNPREQWTDNAPTSRITFKFALEELAFKSPFYTQLAQSGPVPPTLKSEIMQLLPLVQDANAICDDLEKGVYFELRIVHDIHKLLKKSDPNEDFEDFDLATLDSREVAVELNLLKEEMSFVLANSEFMDKYEAIRTVFVGAQDDGVVNTAIGNMNFSPDEHQPLLYDINQEIIIGWGLVSLKPLVYLIQFVDDVTILDYLSLKPKGSIQMEITPCNEYFEKSQDAQHEPFLTNSAELIGQPLHFTFKLGSAESIAAHYKDITCKYKFYSEPTATTGKLDAKPSYTTATSSQFKYERRFSMQHVSPKLIESLERDLLVLTFYGKQRPKKMRNQFKSEYNYSSSNNLQSCEDVTNSPYLGLMQKQRVDLIVSKKAGDRIQQKLNTLHKLVELSENLSQTTVPVEYLKQICAAKDAEIASETLAAFKEEFTPLPDVEPPKKLTTYQKVSEVCVLM